MTVFEMVAVIDSYTLKPCAELDGMEYKTGEGAVMGLDAHMQEIETTVNAKDRQNCRCYLRIKGTVGGLVR